MGCKLVTTAVNCEKLRARSRARAVAIVKEHDLDTLTISCVDNT